MLARMLSAVLIQRKSFGSAMGRLDTGGMAFSHRPKAHQIRRTVEGA
jgi:hypothetical protein